MVAHGFSRSTATRRRRSRYLLYSTVRRPRVVRTHTHTTVGAVRGVHEYNNGARTRVRYFSRCPRVGPSKTFYARPNFWTDNVGTSLVNASERKLCRKNGKRREPPANASPGNKIGVAVPMYCVIGPTTND